MNATFIGVHAYDGDLPDFSVSGMARTKAEMLELLARHDAEQIADCAADRFERFDILSC